MKIEDLSLSALKYFLDAVESQSITLSSEKNHISRPAVSQAILRLEQWSGKALLSHEKRKFALTDEGKRFYALAKQNFENLKHGFAREIESDRSLRIGCSASVIDLVFPKIQGFIRRSHLPTIRIGPTQRLVDLLGQQQIHIAFLIGSHKIAHHKSIMFHSGRFELRSRSGKMSETLIVTERRPEVDAFQSFSIKRKLNFSHRIEVESWSVAARLAEMTDGVCLVPDCLPPGTLRSVALKGWNFPYQVQAVFRKDSLLSDLESELLQRFC